MTKKNLKKIVTVICILSICSTIVPAQAEETDDLFEELYDYGAQLTEDYLPENVVEDYGLPSYEDWKYFWKELMCALQSSSFEDLAWIQPEVEQALRFLQSIPAMRPYADWLIQRLDYCDAARSVVKAVPVQNAKPVERPALKSAKIISPPKPPQKGVVPAVINQKRTSAVQNRQYWKKKVATHPKPEKAPVLIPELKNIFIAEGVSPEWVWIAEVESSLNPNARSPVGAVGLFQFMPPTAERFGLKVKPVDERLDPAKSARAAAKYLKILYLQFRSWPLVIAAYNAGEGTVGRLLKKYSATKFEEIASYLPVETRMYVPKVLAVMELREGKKEETLPAPKVAFVKRKRRVV